MHFSARISSGIKLFFKCTNTWYDIEICTRRCDLEKREESPPARRLENERRGPGQPVEEPPLQEMALNPLCGKPHVPSQGGAPLQTGACARVPSPSHLRTGSILKQYPTLVEISVQESEGDSKAILSVKKRLNCKEDTRFLEMKNIIKLAQQKAE